MLSSQTSKNQYTGNGAVDTYAYGFKIFDDDEIVATIRNTLGEETTLTKTTHYTVSGVGESTGGNVALVNGAFAWLDGDGDLKSGYNLTLRRRLSLVQSTDLRNQGSYHPEDVEDQFDKQIMIDQQLQDQIDRSVKLPETIDDSDFDPNLPADIIDSSSNKVLTVNDDGDGWELKEASEVAALAGQTDHAITESQAATDLTGETLDSALYSSGVYDYEIIRGTTVFSVGRFSLHYRNSTWYFVQWSDNRDDNSVAHGVTFSLSGTTIAQLRAAVATDGAGNGTIKIKKHRFDA